MLPVLRVGLREKCVLFDRVVCRLWSDEGFDSIR